MKKTICNTCHLRDCEHEPVNSVVETLWAIVFFLEAGDIGFAQDLIPKAEKQIRKYLKQRKYFICAWCGRLKPLEQLTSQKGGIECANCTPKREKAYAEDGIIAKLHR